MTEGTMTEGGADPSEGRRQRIRRIVSRITRKASVQRLPEVFAFLEGKMATAPVASPGITLRLAMPGEDHRWFRERPEAFQIAYCEGLRNYLRLRWPATEPPFAVEVALEEGPDWYAQWQLSDPSGRSYEAKPGAGSAYFVFPDETGPIWIPWLHAEDPRCPTSEEEQADPSDIQRLVEGLQMGDVHSPAQPAWRSGACRMLGQKPCRFIRIRADKETRL